MVRSLSGLLRLTSKQPLSHPYYSLSSSYSQHKSSKPPFSSSHLTLFAAALGYLTSTLVLSDNPSPPPELSFSKPSRRSYKYLICGAGVAAQEALSVFLEHNKAADLLLVSPEWRHSRYSPPSLTPQSADPTSHTGILSSILTNVTSILPTSLNSSSPPAPPEIVIGPRVQKVDPSNRIATLDDETEIAFEKCLIAVGNAVPEIPVDKVVATDAMALVSGAQTASDWNAIESVISQGSAMPVGSHQSRAHLTVVGGGWMSTAVGAALVHRGADVTFSYAEPAFLARYFPKYMAHELLARFVWGSDGGVDSMSYAALRYVIARKPLKETFRPVEAEVHVGTVFDSFSIVDFRTDHVVFAPTLSQAVGIDVPSAVVADGGFVVNAELMVASDVYAAGGAVFVGDGALDYAQVMRWSADHAKLTGRHAALNMLGARTPYASRPTLTVDLEALCLSVHIFGDVDGSAETFGYFLRNRDRGKSTCGGQLEIGALFCVAPAPRSHRGAAQRLEITGVALWEGSATKKVPDIEIAKREAQELLQRGPMLRPELEAVMDRFAEDCLGISLYPVRSGPGPEKPKPRFTGNISEDSSGADRGSADVENAVKPLTENRKPAPGVIWRRHRSARLNPVRQDELLWIEGDWDGAVSGLTKLDKEYQAYADLLERARQPGGL